MTSNEAQKLQTGLYRVYWRKGGSSLAAVGTNRDGKRWLTPTSWVGFRTDHFTKPAKIWRHVERVEVIKFD